MRIIVWVYVLLAFRGVAVAAGAPPDADAAAPGGADAGAPDAPPSDGGPGPDARPAASEGAPSATANTTDSEEPALEPVPSPSPRRAVQPTDPTTVKQGAPPPDEWPIEYVLRPQTIPAGRLLAWLSASASLIDADFRSPTGVKYWSWLQAGAGLTFGVSNRIEFSTFVPRLFCESAGSPSACSRYARIDGSGFGFGFGVIRKRAVQLALSTSLQVAVSDPFTVSGAVGARAKVLVADRIALELALAASRWLDPPDAYREAAFGSAILDLNVQVTHNLLVWADLGPNAALDHLGEPRLAPFGGVSWTFENAVQLGASGGVFNVLQRHPWDTQLPGKFFALSLQLWI